MGLGYENEQTVRLIQRGRPVAGMPQPGDMRWRLEMLTDPADTMMLLRGRGFYMQCTGDGEGGYTVEYCEGANAEPFVAVDQTLSLDVTTNLFVCYLCGDDRWRQMVRWVAKSEVEAKKNKKRSFKLVERQGGRLIINKRMCLLTLGIIFCLIGGATFYVQEDAVFLHELAIPGGIIGMGFAIMMISSMTDD